MQRIRRRDFERRDGLRPAKFGISLLLIVATIFAVSFAGSSDWARVLALVLEGTALLFILRTSDAHTRFYGIASIAVIVSVTVASLVAIFGTGEGPGLAAAVVGGFMAIGAPIAILRRLSRERIIDLQVLAGALCLYLLLGLFFTFIYSFIQIVDSDPMFVQLSTKATAAQTIYFSYVTMTTVGYGDLTLGENVPRMIAVTEALLGQLYLVSAVALVVSRLGQERRTTGSAGTEPTDEP